MRLYTNQSPKIDESNGCQLYQPRPADVVYQCINHALISPVFLGHRSTMSHFTSDHVFALGCLKRSSCRWKIDTGSSSLTSCGMACDENLFFQSHWIQYLFLDLREDCLIDMVSNSPENFVASSFSSQNQSVWLLHLDGDKFRGFQTPPCCRLAQASGSNPSHDDAGRCLVMDPRPNARLANEGSHGCWLETNNWSWRTWWLSVGWSVWNCSNDQMIPSDSQWR